MEFKSLTILLVLPILVFAKPQYQYDPANPYQLPQFSNLYTTSYTTPYPMYGQQNMRIWPYVTGGQATYNPYNSNPWNLSGYNTYNTFDVNSWRNWYYSILPYGTNFGKK